jgi:hypothetical protein
MGLHGLEQGYLYFTLSLINLLTILDDCFTTLVQITLALLSVLRYQWIKEEIFGF